MIHDFDNNRWKIMHEIRKGIVNKEKLNCIARIKKYQLYAAERQGEEENNELQ